MCLEDPHFKSEPRQGRNRTATIPILPFRHYLGFAQGARMNPKLTKSQGKSPTMGQVGLSFCVGNVSEASPILATRLALDYSIVKNSTTGVGEFIKGSERFSTLMIDETAIEFLTFSTVCWALAHNYEVECQSNIMEGRHSSEKNIQLMIG